MKKKIRKIDQNRAKVLLKEKVGRDEFIALEKRVTRLEKTVSALS